jgi:CRP-like cAMP-binding protein
LILCQGSSPQYGYILVEGEAGVYQLAMNGIEYLAYEYGDNELFGEVEILNGRSIVSNIRANGLCRVIRIAKDDFMRWIEADPAFQLYVCRQLAEKLYNASIISVTHIAYPLKYRVLYYLWDACQHGNKYIKKSDIISRLGSSERSINRIIKELANSIMLETGRGVVKVNSMESIIEEMKRYE